MKILFLTQLFPHPPVCGGTIRSFNMLRHLGARHDVTLVSFVRGETPEASAEALRSICREVHTVPIHRSSLANIRFALGSLLGKKPFIVARDYVPEMRRKVDDLLNNGHFDLIYVDHLQMAQYVSGWDGCPKILDEHNVEWKIIERIGNSEPLSPKRLYAAIEWRKLRRWELATCERFDRVLTVTKTDRDTLRSANHRLSKITCIPIGVDFEAFPKVELREDARDIVSIGTMSWPPNIDAAVFFAEKIYPAIKMHVDRVRYIVAGSNPTDAVRRLSLNDSSIEVTGYLDDLTPVASQAAVFVTPLRSGSGLRVKILNAMAMGLPVVSTSVGCEGIGAKPGRDLIVADSEHQFADAVVELMSDFRMRRQIAENGREFVHANYSWESIYDRLDETLDQFSEEALAANSR
jgi:polysaccharide biosynthesis protein PslH